MRHRPHERDRALIAKANLLLPVLIAVSQRVTLAVVFPAEDLADKVHALIDVAVRNIRLGLGITCVEAFGGRTRRHDLMNCLLLVFVGHGHTNDGYEGREPLVAAFARLEDLLELVEDKSEGGALEAGEEVLELTSGHAGGGVVLNVCGWVGVRVHFGECLGFSLFGNGDGVGHYVSADNEAENLAEELGLGKSV